MTKLKHDKPILVTGAAGAVGGIGRNLTEFLLARGHKVRALVRREDKRAEALRQLGADVVQGDLTDLASMHRAIESASISECLCRRLTWKPRSTPPPWRATMASRFS
jgi:nucleoside-diphosphate-sugar epimerase